MHDALTAFDQCDILVTYDAPPALSHHIVSLILKALNSRQSMHDALTAFDQCDILVTYDAPPALTPHRLAHLQGTQFKTKHA